MSLTNLDLSARSLSLRGAVDLAPDGLPTRFDVTGQIAAPDGSRVLLPTSDRIEIDRADLTLAFDATTDEGWRGAIMLTGLDRDDFDADRLALLPQTPPVPWDDLMHHAPYLRALERLAASPGAPEAGLQPLISEFFFPCGCPGQRQRACHQAYPESAN